MAKTIFQTVNLPASPQTLYKMFITSKLHAAACGGSARIVPKVGGAFSIWDGALTGKTLLLKPGKMIVQSWRSSNFKAADPDSILILTFSGTAKRGTIAMVHANVADGDAEGVRQGWPAYYWQPWKLYLQGKQAPKPPKMGKMK